MIVQDLLDGAYGYSSKNQPGRIAAESTELVNLVNRLMRSYYSFAARINPLYFASSSSVAFASPGWARPATAELIFRIENATPAEVVVVPYNDRNMESGLPAVYRLGRIFRPASANAPNPQSGNLTFFYSMAWPVIANLTDTLDASWNDDFADLPMTDIALYLAQKDGRVSELDALRTQRAAAATRFGAFLEHETANERRRFGIVRMFNGPTLIPTISLVTPDQDRSGQGQGQ